MSGRNPTNVIQGAYGSVNPVTPAIYRAPPKPQAQNRSPVQAKEQMVDPQDPASIARAVNQLQQNVAAATEQVKGIPFANGNLIENVTFVNGSISGGLPVASTLTVVEHRLGRQPKGYIVTSISGGYFGIGIVRYAWDDRTISLFGQKVNWTGSTQVLISVYVF